MPPALENPIVLWFVLAAALAGLAYAFVRPELRTRAILYGAFLVACGVSLWPPYATAEKPGRIKLGLDLRGGIHLVLQVVVDDALNATVDDAVQTAREQAIAQGHHHRWRPAHLSHLVLGGRGRARAGQGHARHPEGLPPHRLGAAGARERAGSSWR